MESPDPDHDSSNQPSEQKEEPVNPPRTGLVTAVGVINIVFGSLFCLPALLGLFAGLLMMTSDRLRDSEEGFLIAVISLFWLLIGALYLISGIGIFNRRKRSRNLSLVLAAFNLLMAVGSIIAIVGVFTEPGAPGLSEDDLIGLVFFVFVGVLFNTGYGLFTYLTLLPSDVVREFR